MKDSNKAKLLQFAQQHTGKKVEFKYCPDGADAETWDLLSKTKPKFDGEGNITKYPAPHNNRSNLAHILENDPKFKTLGYNPHSDSLLWGDRTIDDSDVEEIAIYLEGYRLYIKSDRAIKSAVTRVAMKNQIEPIKDYLESCHKKWKLAKKPKNLYMVLESAFHADFNPIYQGLIQDISKKWFISCVARIFDPGCEVHTCLGLISTQKGVGKGFSMKALACEEWFSNSNIDIGSKHGYMAIHQAHVWIWEIAEMASLQGKSAEAFKAFVTGAWDRYTASYGHFPKHRPRRTVFVLSSNNKNILSDGTERRLWPIVIKPGYKIELDWLKENRDLLWGEAVDLYKKKEPWHLNDKMSEALREYQIDFKIDDPWSSKVRECIISKSGASTSEIMDFLQLPIAQQHTGNSKRIAHICKELGYTQTNTGGEGRKWRQ